MPITFTLRDSTNNSMKYQIQVDDNSDNDYWLKANSTLNITTKGYDSLSGMKYSYLALNHPSDGVSAYHDWTNTSTHVFENNSSIFATVDSATEIEESNGSYTVKWGVSSKDIQGDLGVQWYFRDITDWVSRLGVTGIKLHIDPIAPEGSIFIANDSEKINTDEATLTFAATDVGSGVYEMQFSNDNVNWSAWEPYSTTKNWTLSEGQNGLRTVWVRYKDRVGNISVYNDTITLEFISITQGNTTSTIEYANEYDLFSLWAPQDGNLTASLTGAANVNIDMQLLDSNGVTLQSSSSGGSDEFISYNLIKGNKYYMKIFGVNGAFSPEPYTIKVSFPYEYVYDNSNRLDYINLLSGKMIDYTYDNNGNLLQVRKK